jgi:hypothetical protein
MDTPPKTKCSHLWRGCPCLPLCLDHLGQQQYFLLLLLLLLLLPHLVGILVVIVRLIGVWFIIRDIFIKCLGLRFYFVWILMLLNLGKVNVQAWPF